MKKLKERNKKSIREAKDWCATMLELSSIKNKQRLDASIKKLGLKKS